MATINDFKESQVLTLDQQLQSQVRHAINTYAKSVPNHPLNNLGDEVKLTSAVSQSYITICLRSEFDTRRLLKHSEPWREQQYSHQKRESSVWQYRFPVNTAKFYMSSRMSVVEGTDQVLRCQSCTNGSNPCTVCDSDGKVRCDDCSGRGRVNCSSCRGSGERTCQHCSGKGSIRCNNCYGKGKVEFTDYRTEYRYNYNTKRNEPVRVPYTAYKNCITCGGSGKIDCRYCWGKGAIKCNTCSGSGKLTCNTCSGKGRVTCSTCHGYRRVICSTCDGQAQLFDYTAIHQDMSHDQLIRSLCSDALKASGEFYEKVSSLHAEQIYYDVCDRGVVDVEPLEKYGNASVVQAVRQLQRDFQSRENDNVRIAFQDLRIERVVGVLVSYQYHGQTYVGVLHNGQFYPGPTSPISNLAEEIMDRSDKYLRFRMYPQAYHSASLANVMKVYGTESRAFRLHNLAEEKMLQLHDLGSTLALLSGLYLGLPAIYDFYTRFNPVLSYVASVNDPNSRGYGFFPMMMCLLCILLAYWAYRKTKSPFSESLYLKLTRSSLLGIGIGFVTTALSIVVVWLVFALVNAAGLCWIINLVDTIFIYALIIVVVLLFYAVMILISLFKWLWGLIF